MDWKISLTEPVIAEEEIEAVISVLRSKWLTMGAVTEEFERKFAEKMNVKHAIAVSNCTAALHLANIVLGVTVGDEVICPNLTFVASANATRYTGADVVLVDVVSENDLTINPKDIESKITERTKAITVVHYAGFSCLMDEIMEIADRYGLKIIEDCAHAPFGMHRFKNGQEKFVGSIGDVGCFSFFGNKNMTTGEGGMVTTNNDALAKKVRLLRSHAMTSVTYDRHKGHASGYDVIGLGFNYRLDEIRSAIGLAQLKKIDILSQRRRDVFRWYVDVLGDSSIAHIPFQQRDLSLSVPHIMPVIIKDGYEFRKERLRDYGIQTSKHYDQISSFSFYKGKSSQNKQDFFCNLLTLPMGPDLKKADVELIGSVLNG